MTPLPPCGASRGALLLVLGAALCALPSGPAAAAEEGSPRRFDLHLAGDGTVHEQRTLRVSRGDLVEIEIRSDAPAELHLHGYDLSAHAAPGAPATMRFEARVTGRFPIERHGDAHGVVLYLEVHP